MALRTSDEVRLVDDAFIKICQMVNDLSMKVRAEAAGLLGSLHHVSPRFLQQTLDKKVMSHLKVSCAKTRISITFKFLDRETINLLLVG